MSIQTTVNFPLLQYGLGRRVQTYDPATGQITFTDYPPTATEPLVDRKIRVMSYPGVITTKTLEARWYPINNVVLQRVDFALSVAPATTSVSIDVLKNGVSIFGANPKPTVTAGNNKSSAIDVSVSMTPNDYLTVALSGTEGENLVANILYV